MNANSNVGFILNVAELQDANDELNAQLLNRGLEEGRTLLTTINSVPAADSLAAEFEAMSQDQVLFNSIINENQYKLQFEIIHYNDMT